MSPMAMLSGVRKCCYFHCCTQNNHFFLLLLVLFSYGKNQSLLFNITLRQKEINVELCCVQKCNIKCCSYLFNLKRNHIPSKMCYFSRKISRKAYIITNRKKMNVENKIAQILHTQQSWVETSLDIINFSLSVFFLYSNKKRHLECSWYLLHFHLAFQLNQISDKSFTLEINQCPVQHVQPTLHMNFIQSNKW